MGGSSLLYLKDFCRTEKKIMTSELDREYIQELITLQDLNNNGMSRGEVIGIIQIITGASLKNMNSTGTISVKQRCFRSSIIMAPYKLPTSQQPSGAV